MPNRRSNEELEQERDQGALGRLAATAELLMNLDRRVIKALDGLDEMRDSVGGIGTAEGDVKELVADLRERVARLHERLDDDMDTLRDALLAKIGDVDLTGIGGRLDRLEQAVYNIERSTMSMDESLNNTLQALPGFLTRKIQPSEPEHDGAHPG